MRGEFLTDNERDAAADHHHHPAEMQHAEPLEPVGRELGERCAFRGIGTGPGRGGFCGVVVKRLVEWEDCGVSVESDVL